MTLQGLQDGQDLVWIAPQTLERLIDKGEVEFHHRDPQKSATACSAQSPVSPAPRDNFDCRRSWSTCKPSEVDFVVPARTYPGLENRHRGGC